MENTFKWCGYNWKSSMEGGRLIHPKEPWMWIDKDQVKLVDKNTIELTLAYNPNFIEFEGKEYYPSMGCGLIRSVEDFDYGTFSAEIKLPQGCNLWPSFWLTGSENWPPEIDICEAELVDTDNYFEWFTTYFPWLNPSWKTKTNAHYNNKKIEHCQIGGRNVSWFKQCKEPSENFIEYKCEWKPDSITFYVNNKKVRRITGKVCKYLTENLTHPDKTYKMNAVFNLFCEDASNHYITLGKPMLIRNFKYEQL